MSADRLVSVPEFQQRIDASLTGGAFSAGESAIHGSILDQVSQSVHEYCADWFGRTASATRVFTAKRPDLLVIPAGEPCVVSITTLKTDDNHALSYDTTWATTDYELEPHNAASRWPARPYYQIRASTATGSSYRSFPLTPRGVQIVGVFGWPEVPAIVRECVIREGLRALKQIENPAGVMSNSMGQVMIEPGLHPATVRDLAKYRRMWIP